MRSQRNRVAELALILMAATATACTTAATEANIRTAESAANVRASATAKKIDAGAAAEAPAPAAPASDAIFEQPFDLGALEEAVIARQPGLVAAEHRIRALVERARAEGKLPPAEVMADVWQVPFARPYAFDKAGMIMFSIRQQFPPAGALDKAAEAMALEAQAEAEKAEAEARALVREADRAFADYAEVTARHAAHEAHRGLVVQMLEAARVRVETGGALGDFSRAELELARTDADIAKERGMLDEARAKLNGLLLRPPGERLGPPRHGEPETTSLGPKEAAAIAARESPEVRMAERMAESARASAIAANREASTPMFTAGISTFMPVNDMPAGYGVSLGMSLPWLSGAASSRARSAAHKELAERATGDAARARVRTDAVVALASLRAAERRYQILRNTAAPSADRAVEVARAGYATGGTDLAMWLDAARMALDIDVDVAVARGDLDRALADLDGAAGGRVPRIPLAASAASKETGHDP
ncbi:MAG: TolC family protein [Byssovorax sp.]